MNSTAAPRRCADIHPTSTIRTSASPSVLVVEDDMDILGGVREILEDQGYQVLSAANGCSAVLLAESRAPDVILLDLCLPEMDGEEFCQTIQRHLGRLPPVVMVSANPDLAEVCTRLGIHHYLAKPFDLDELLDALDAARAEAHDAP